MFRLRFRWKNLFQLSGLALFFILAWQTRYPLPLKGWSSAFFRLDPFLALTTALAAKTVVIAFWPALILLALTLFFGRFFCWNVCPLGSCMDLGMFLIGRKRWRKKPGLKPLFAVQSSVLIIFLALAGFGFSGITQQFDPLVISLGILLSLPGLILFLTIVLVSVVFPRFWCFNLCPLGAMLEVTARAGKKIRKRPAPVDLSRRQFLSALFLGILAGGGLKIKKKRETDGRVLRPPAAGKEPEFTSRCVRCGECVKVCPTGGLKPCFLETGLEGLGTPRLVPRIGACELCFLCWQVCPSNAIKKARPGEFKIGTAQIDRSRCIAWEKGKLCLICMEYCPVAAISADEKKRPIVNETACIGCGACEKQCPVSGEAAIVVFNRGEIRG